MTEDQLKKAEELWKRGVKTQDIANAVGVSKPTMSWTASKNRARFPARNANFYRASGFHAKHIENRAKAKATIAEKWPEKAPQYLVCEETGKETTWFHEGRTVRNMPPCSCGFPLWGHHETFDVDTSLYCGAPRAEGHNYCDFHRDLTTGSARAVIPQKTWAGAFYNKAVAA